MKTKTKIKAGVHVYKDGEDSMKTKANVKAGDQGLASPPSGPRRLRGRQTRVSPTGHHRPEPQRVARFEATEPPWSPVVRRSEVTMTGTAPVPSGAPRRRALEAAINLVPFIDLLSCCIAFLLITAGWTQMSAVEVRPAEGERGGVPGVDSPLALTLFVDGGGYTLARSSGETQAVPLRAGMFDDARLGVLLGEARPAVPSAVLSVRAADAVDCDRLVRTIDLARGAQFTDVSLGARDAR